VNPSVSEQDLELLETYLDNELVGEEMNLVRLRLKREPALALALEQITRDRQLRHQVFFEMDREIAATARGSTDKIARSLRQAATREVVWSNRRSLLRQFSAAAACIVVGLLVGWFGRERANSFNPDRSNGRVAIERMSAEPVTTVGNSGGNGFNVAITDDRGTVLAQQHFNTLAEARQFANDLLRWQTKQREMRNGDVRLIGGKF
jgi:hypothetical protein